MFFPCPRWELEEEHRRNAAGLAGPCSGLAAISMLGLCSPSCSLPDPILTACVLQVQGPAWKDG